MFKTIEQKDNETDECKSSNIELQTAYAISQRIGIMANFQRAWGGRVSTNNYAKGTFFESAIGYYKPMEKHLVFEIY